MKFKINATENHDSCWNIPANATDIIEFPIRSTSSVKDDCILLDLQARWWFMEEVAAVLFAAARQAHAKGATSAAAELAGLAARLSPGDAVRFRRQIEAAEYLFQAGDAGQARRLLEELVASAPDGAFPTAGLIQGKDGALYGTVASDRR